MTDQELTQLIFQSLLIINHPQNLVTFHLFHLGPGIYLAASTYIKLIKSNGHSCVSPGLGGDDQRNLSQAKWEEWADYLRAQPSISYELLHDKPPSLMA